MARLRQIHPNQYTGSGRISAEFESVIRYLNAAELGNKSLADLLSIIFNDDGEFEGPVEFRFDAATGLEYRIGTYTDDDAGWLLIADAEDLTGAPGTNIGTLEAPPITNRQDTVASGGETYVSYAFDTTIQDLVVYKNGLLLRETADYTKNDALNRVEFVVALSASDKISIYSIRDATDVTFRRSDQTATASQAVFAFVHTAEETLLVFRNGLLQRYGGGYDYTNDAAADTITFTSGLTNGDKVTIMVVTSSAVSNVIGLMLTAQYCDASNNILWSKVAVADGAIAQAKVSGLVAALSAKGKLTVSASTPSTPAAGDLWLDISVVPNLLKFYGSDLIWYQTSPSSSVPNYAAANAGQYLRVNGTGTSLEWGAIDFSAYVPKTYMGAANGVASLDSTGRVPSAQMPQVFGTDSIPLSVSGSVSNVTYLVKRLFKQKVRLDGLTCKLSAGTCTIQVSVDGSVVGSTQAVSSTVADVTFGTSIEIDARTTSKRLAITVTGATGASDLEVSLAAATLSS